MVIHKVCKKCGLKLAIDNFTPSKNIRDGYENTCKKCRQLARIKYKASCVVCGKEFSTSNKQAVFCSTECQHETQKKGITVHCAQCGKEKHVPVSKSSRNKSGLYFCNMDCKAQYQKSSMQSEQNPNYNRVPVPCSGCGKEILVIPFKIKSQKSIYCCKECFKQHFGETKLGELNYNFKSKVLKICITCGSPYYRKPGDKSKYCSKECYYIHCKELFKYRRTSSMEPCATCGKPVNVTPHDKKIKKHHFCSKECKDNGNSIYYSGPNHPQWKSDKPYQERIAERLLGGYKAWRTTVFLRDHYTCVRCKDNNGGNLVAHHLNSWASTPQDRYKIDNGVTLCKDCHRKFHKLYGWGKNTKRQFAEWMSNTNYCDARFQGRD